MDKIAKYYVNCCGRLRCRGYSSLDVYWFRQSYGVDNDYGETTMSFFDCVFSLGVI